MKIQIELEFGSPWQEELGQKELRLVLYAFQLQFQKNHKKNKFILKEFDKNNNEIIRTYHDEDCPKCGFPETIIVRNAKTMKPIWIECSQKKYGKCEWKKTYPKERSKK